MYFASATSKLVLVEGLRRLGHRVPEARSRQRILNGSRLVAVLFRLGQIADGAGKVLLLHAQKSHARRNASVLRLLPQQFLEARLRFVQPVRVQCGKGRALGRRARNAGVHLRKLAFIRLQVAGDFRVLRMRLQILAQLRRRGRIGRVPYQRLAQRRLRIGILRMRFENANAFGPGLRVVGQHACPAQRQRVASPGLRSASERMPAIAAALPVAVPKSV